MFTCFYINLQCRFPPSPSKGCSYLNGSLSQKSSLVGQSFSFSSRVSLYSGSLRRAAGGNTHRSSDIHVHHDHYHLASFFFGSPSMFSNPDQKAFVGTWGITRPLRQSTRSAGSSPKSLRKLLGVHSSLVRHWSTLATTTGLLLLHTVWKGKPTNDS